MEKAKTKVPSQIVSSCERNLRSSTTSQLKPTGNLSSFSLQTQLLNSNNLSPPSLLSLCLGHIGCNLEEIIDHLSDLAPALPSHIKLVLFAIARRRKLLGDVVLIALADSSWEIVDLSGSNVSDSGLHYLVDVCQNLKAVDISQLTAAGVSKLLQHYHSLETLRWGGCSRSEHIAHECLSLLKPNLTTTVGETWEELDASKLSLGTESLRWLVWPKIEKSTHKLMALECPRIVVNPNPSLLGHRGIEVPREALLQYALDDPIVENIDPKTWAVQGFNVSLRSSLLPVVDSNEISIAEKFRLAFLERDARLAPKRAKNARQHQRRSEREWMMRDSKAKASALASKVVKDPWKQKFCGFCTAIC